MHADRILFFLKHCYQVALEQSKDTVLIDEEHRAWSEEALTDPACFKGVIQHEWECLFERDETPPADFDEGLDEMFAYLDKVGLESIKAIAQA